MWLLEEAVVIYGKKRERQIFLSWKKKKRLSDWISEWQFTLKNVTDCVNLCSTGNKQWQLLRSKRRHHLVLFTCWRMADVLHSTQSCSSHSREVWVLLTHAAGSLLPSVDMNQGWGERGPNEKLQESLETLTLMCGIRSMLVCMFYTSDV